MQEIVLEILRGARDNNPTADFVVLTVVAAVLMDADSDNVRVNFDVMRTALMTSSRCVCLFFFFFFFYLFITLVTL